MSHEMHEHIFISGPRAGSLTSKIYHSHEGGDQPHRHPDTGPASYTIDKDDWLRLTGLVGGGRKAFSARPKGEQFPLVPATISDTTFTVIGCDPPSIPPGFNGTGGGVYTMSRMVLGHRMRPAFRIIPGGAA